MPNRPKQLSSRSSDPSEEKVVLGECRLNPITGELSRDNQLVRLEPKSQRVLLLLIEFAGEVVSREMFHQRIWHGRAVTDDALNRCIRSLRVALGDDQSPRRYIETLPKLGYRLCCPMPAEASSRSGRSEGPSIAVLSFKDLSDKSEPDLFCEALRADIITGLIQSSHLSVVASGAIEGVSIDDQESLVAGASAGAHYLLGGTVRKSDGNLRVAVRLVDCRTGVQAWSQKYDRALSVSAMFAVQDDIRERIVATLSDLHGVIYSSKAKYSRGKGTESLEAYECLAIALEYDKYISEEQHLRARDHLELAVQIDPQYDEAWAHLSWLYTDELVWGFNPLPDSMDRALAVAQRSLVLAPDNYHNHWLLSRVHYFLGNLEGFLAESHKALELNANDGTTLGLVGMYTAWTGEWQLGLDMMEKAKQLNPNYPGYYHFVAATAHYADREYAAAGQQLARANLPDWPMTLIFMVAVANQLGQNEKARQYLTRLGDLGGPTTGADIEAYLSRSFPFLPDLVTATVRAITQRR